MTEIEKLLKTAMAEVGYCEKSSNKNLDNKTTNSGDKNYTKYARDLDENLNFYNGKKQGFAWCDVFVDWCFVESFGVERAKKLLCHPEKSLGAGVGYSRSYYSKKKQYHTSNPKKGDQIFFKKESSITHTGIVYDVDNTYVYTIEGNTTSSTKVVSNGGEVCSKKYKLTSTYIDGYGRPNYSDSKQDEINDKEVIIKYVKCDILNVRSGPSTSYKILRQVSKGTMVCVYEEKNTWSRINDKEWVSTNFLSLTNPTIKDSISISQSTNTKSETLTGLNNQSSDTKNIILQDSTYDKQINNTKKTISTIKVITDVLKKVLKFLFTKGK